MSENRISVSVCTEDIATCGSCFARNYEPDFPQSRGRIVDRLYEVRVDNVVTRLCGECLKKLSDSILEIL